MEAKVWETIRDEMVTKAENWLDGLGYSALTVKATLMDMKGVLSDDESGQVVIEDGLASALELNEVYVRDNVARMLMPGTGLHADVTLPIPVREFIRGWNEGTLQ